MAATPDILQKILARKSAEIAQRASALPLRTLSERAEAAAKPRGFLQALLARVQQEEVAVIAEIKKASPSKGLLREDFDAPAIARSYASHGATCLSVLTDVDFFQGSDADLQAVRQACELPLLRKDFVIDAYQVYEARALGADCILLIVAALGDAQLLELSGLARHLEMDVLIEVHDQHELERALALRPPMIGINNRDLRSFETRLDTTLSMLPLIPQGCLVVTESGIHTEQDMALMRGHGVHSFLIGEAFMRCPDPGAKLAELLAAGG